MTEPDQRIAAEIERLDLNSMSITDDRISKLREDFPEVFREDKIDFDALKRSLGEWVDPGKERFGLNWPGKAECMRIIQEPSVGTLVPMREESVDFDTTRNVIIEGENLEVLKLLQKSYYGKVKMIYIDPPYNTGNEFIYPDNFKEGLQDYLRYSGQVDGEGIKTSTNTESEGRYHSKWLNMMYPRLFLARNLLRDDGVIFVSIDDHEVANLRLLLNEVFGEENDLGVIVWKKKTNGNNMGFIPPVHDYVLCYGRIASDSSILGFPLTDEQIAATYSNPDRDPRGPWTTSDLSANHKGPYFPITNPATGESFLPPLGRYWVFGEDDVKRRIDEGRIIFGKKGTGRPIQKRFFSERTSNRLKAESWWDRHGMNQDGSEELTSLLGKAKVFSHPKPSTLLKHLIAIATEPNSKHLILDFFSGSGSIGHAVYRQNAEDAGNRKFVLVQIPEPTENDYQNISALGRDRVRSAGRSVSKELLKQTDSSDKIHSESDFGFRPYRLTVSNFRPWTGDSSHDGAIDRQLEIFSNNLLDDRTSEDILIEILLKSGFQLTDPVVRLELSGKEVFSIADGSMLVCLERKLSLEVIEAMAAVDPGQIVVLDAGFANNDQLKVNAVQAINARARGGQETIAFKVV